ncbi:hypothetical protein HY090_01460 [Candidatus Kaiserbacteria bacterium]|nr:hypothetical protein [Candidatus Kaiserbacteria bacterium]
MATIDDVKAKINTISAETREKIFYVALIVLVALLAFGLGRLSVFYGGTSDFKIIYPSTASSVR